MAISPSPVLQPSQGKKNQRFDGETTGFPTGISAPSQLPPRSWNR